MNKSLATFMSLAITAAILFGLILGIAYQALSNKNNQQSNTLKNEYQLKINN